MDESCPDGRLARPRCPQRRSLRSTGECPAVRPQATTAQGIPEATIARLPLYLRCSARLRRARITTVSSEELAAAAGVNSAKLRKDLSHLGSYGTRGVGYDVDYLVYQVSRELGLTQDWPVVIVGAGNLGRVRWRTTAASPPAASASRRSSTPTRRWSAAEIARLWSSTPTRWSRPSSRSRRRYRRHRHPGRIRPGGLRPPCRRRGHEHPQLRARRDSACRAASTCVRSTCRSSCRSWPSTRSARSAAFRAAPDGPSVTVPRAG